MTRRSPFEETESRLTALLGVSPVTTADGVTPAPGAYLILLELVQNVGRETADDLPVH